MLNKITNLMTNEKMKKPLQIIFYLSALILSMQSCIDKDFDDINKNVEFKVPPIPFGSLDTIYLPQLPPLPIALNYTVEDTIKNLFDEDTNDKFFYEGADDVELTGGLDLVLKNPAMQGTTLNVTVKVVDYQNEAYVSNPATVTFSPTTVSVAKDQAFTVTIGSDEMKHMKNANGLVFRLQFNIPSITLDSDDYLLLKDVVIKTGGINFDL